MQLSEVFKLVRERIRTKQRNYICFAVYDVLGKDTKEADHICGKIEDALHPCCSIAGWMEHYNHKQYVAMRFEDFRELRLKWCDALIAHCEAVERGEIPEHAPYPSPVLEVKA